MKFFSFVFSTFAAFVVFAAAPQTAEAIPTCPVNKSFHVKHKCKCPKGTRYGAVSAAYRMCKTPTPPSCGVNRQFRVGTYCRCPRGTKVTRARHHLFRICRPIPRPKLCPVNKSFHVKYKCKCPKGTRYGAVSAAYRMCKTLLPPSCGVNRQFRAGTYCRCPKGTRVTRAAHHLFRICRPIPRLKLCPINKSFHVKYKCKCPKGTRYGAVSAAYRMCKTLIPPSCGVNRQYRLGTYCRCPKGTKVTRARHHLFRICRPIPSLKLCPVNKSFHVKYKCKCPKGTRFGAVSAAYRMCKTLIPPSCGVNRQFRAGTYCRCPKGTRVTRAAHHLFRICQPIARRGYCGCYNLRALCAKLRGAPRAFPRYGLFCVIKNQSASYVHTLSYRMQDFPKDCVMFRRKLGNNLGKLIRSKRLTCR